MSAESDHRPEYGMAAYEPSFGDEAARDAFTSGGEAEESLRRIDPVLWAKGAIGVDTNRYAGEVSDEELMVQLDRYGRSEWDEDTLKGIIDYLES